MAPVVYADEARYVRRVGHLSDRDIARTTGAGERAERLVELSAMVERLARVVPGEYIPVWLNKPVPALGDHKPLDALAAGQYLSVATLISELDDVLGRARIAVRLDTGALDRLRRVLAEAPLLEDPAVEAISRDPTDDYLIALARASGADCLISGDKDLVSLVDLDPPVLTPTQALDRLRAEHPV